MKKFFIAILLLTTITNFSQINSRQDVLPIRLGLKIGTPQLVAPNLEIVTPLLNYRIAFYGDYIGFSVNTDDFEGKYKYYELGSNIYFFGGKGRYIYGSFGYGNLKLDGTFDDVEPLTLLNFSEGSNIIADAKGVLQVETFNAKLGVKFGNRIFIRIEAGYAFGEVPETIIVNGNVNGVPTAGVVEIDFDETKPFISENGYAIANVGFGVAF